MSSSQQQIKQLIDKWKLEEAFIQMDSLAQSIDNHNKRNIAIKAVSTCRREILEFEASAHGGSVESAVIPAREEHARRMLNLLTWICNNPIHFQNNSDQSWKRPARRRSDLSQKTSVSEDGELTYSTSPTVVSPQQVESSPAPIIEETTSPKEKKSLHVGTLLMFLLPIVVGLYCIVLPWVSGIGTAKGTWPIVLGLLGILVPAITYIEQILIKQKSLNKSGFIFFGLLTVIALAGAAQITHSWQTTSIITGRVTAGAIPAASMTLNLYNTDQSSALANTTSDDNGNFVLAVDSENLSGDSVFFRVSDENQQEVNLDYLVSTAGKQKTCKINGEEITKSDLTVVIAESAATTCYCKEAPVQGKLYVMSSDRALCEANTAAHDSIVVTVGERSFSLLTDENGAFSFPFTPDWTSDIRLTVFHGSSREKCCFTASRPGYMGECEADSAEQVSVIVRAIPIMSSSREGDECFQYKLSTP